MDLSSYSVEAITRRRPLTTTSNQQGEQKNNKLKRSLGLADVIFYGVGCSVGAGIYSLVGIGAHLAGPSIALSFGLCGVACCFTSLAYAEFAARVPLAGSAYTFTYVSFGELCGWLVGWNLTLGYGVSASVVARSWAEYVVGFIQGFTEVDLVYLTKLPLPSLFGNDYTCCPLSMLIIGVCTLILVSGVRESSRFNTAMTLLNLSILLFVLLSGIASGSVRPLTNLQPVFPHGVTGMARAAGLVFFSYLGFDMVACLSEECQNPERNMPIGIIGSLMVSMGIYVAVSIVVVGMAPVALLGQDTPITNALLANACCTPTQQLAENAPQECLSYTSCEPILHPLLYVGSRFISFGAIFGLTSATFACLFGQPRISFAAAQDGLFFRVFARVHPRTGVPTMGTILTGIVTAVIACLFELESLANTISLGTLQVFTFVNAGVIILRMRGATCSVTEDDLQSFPDESSALMTRPVPPSPLVRDPFAATVARSLGLVKQSSRDIRHMLQQRDHERASETTTPVWLVLVFTISSIAASFGISNGWNVYILVGCGFLIITSALCLFLQHKSPPPETFTCPLVPAVPLMGILCNSYMMGSLPTTTWCVILGWLLAGLLFYLTYGIHHSELRKTTVAR